MYVYDLDIETDGILGSDFSEKYEGIVNLKNKQEITRFRTVPLFKFEENRYSENNQNFQNDVETTKRNFS